MALLPILVASAVLTFFAYRLLYGTDRPKIKGIPEIPGLPLFGSLYELGQNHALVAQKWARKYGPVFQVRMGNRVSIKCTTAHRISRVADTGCICRGLYLSMILNQSSIFGLRTRVL